MSIALLLLECILGVLLALRLTLGSTRVGRLIHDRDSGFLLLFFCCSYRFLAAYVPRRRWVYSGQGALVQATWHLSSLSLLHGGSLHFDCLCFSCLFEAVSLLLGEIPVDAPLDVCPVELSRFVVNNGLQRLGSSHRGMPSWSALFSFSSDLVREVVRAARQVLSLRHSSSESQSSPVIALSCSHLVRLRALGQRHAGLLGYLLLNPCSSRLLHSASDLCQARLPLFEP